MAAEQPPVEAAPARQQRRRGDASSSRVFCPVPGCLHGDTHGWATMHIMRNHLEAHRLGHYAGEIPQSWLLSHRLATCSHCNRLVSGGPGAMHTSCRAEARPAGAPSSGLSASSGQRAANLEAVLAADRPTIKHIPAKCKALWSAVLTRALSTAVLASSSSSGHGQEEQAWVELLCLPKAVLSQAPRAGVDIPSAKKISPSACCKAGWTETKIACLLRPRGQLTRRGTDQHWTERPR